MTTLRTLLFCLLAAAYASTTAWGQSSPVRTVTLVGDPWPPYIVGELGHEATGGVGVELMNAIFDQLPGVNLSIPLVPWNRALRDVARGTQDGIGILVKTPEREAYLDYTDELFRSHNTVWYFADRFPQNFKWQEYTDFAPYRIGIVRGHSYGIELDQMINSGILNVVEVSSAHQLFAMLERNRFDLAFANRLVGSAFVEPYVHAAMQLRATDKNTATEIYYIAFSKRSEARHLIPAINRTIVELRNAGLIDSLVGTATAAGHQSPDR